MGKTLFELAKQAQPDYPHQIILAKVDGKLHELKDMEIENEKVEYITTAADRKSGRWQRNLSEKCSAFNAACNLSDGTGTFN